MSGRPLRFLGTAVVGWVAIRTVMLWPVLDSPGALPRLLIPTVRAEPEPMAIPATAAPRAVGNRDGSAARFAAARMPRRVVATGSSFPVQVITLAAPARVTALPPPPDAVPIAPLAAPVPGRLPPPRRWTGSAWLVLRDGRGFGPSFGGGQLGGAQAGARLAYAIDGARRVAVVARVTSPLRGPGREASIGVEWRVAGLPVRLVAEHRFAMDGGSGGPAVGVIAGTGPAPLAAGLDLETYGQAGVIRRDRTEPFAEGAARLTRPAARTGHVTFDLGVGAWGAAQRDAQRLELGPTVGVALPVGGRTLRALLDWRQRIAGRTRPGSGPALTIGADF